jgi:hypothetical protein
MTTASAHGIQFPAADAASRGSSQAGTRIVAAALHPLDPVLAERVRSERRWRRNYPQHIRALVRHALPDPELAIASARAGLDCAWDTLHWADADGRRPLGEAWRALRPPPLHTLRVAGQGNPRPRPCQIPYRGQLLEDDALLRQADDWERRHIIEPSAAAALRRCVVNPEWFDLSDRTIVLLGAGAEVGPLNMLAYWRANVVAVDRAVPQLWLRAAANVVSGNASLLAPLDGVPGKDADADLARAGVDLLSDAPRLAEWLVGLDRPLDLLSLAYADGERHLRIALAMDWIARAVLDANPASTLSWLATPTDAFVMPAHVARASMRAYDSRSLLPRLLRPALSAAWQCFHPNVEELHAGPQGREYAMADSLVVQQGPNYALAKRVQQWRAVEARARGHRVSLNIAPATTTASVTANPILAAAYAGAHRFGIEVFAPETTRALMAALWVHDLRCDASAANPQTPLAHPWELFTDNACHGGFWACPYLPRTALPFAAAMGWAAGKLG